MIGVMKEIIPFFKASAKCSINFGKIMGSSGFDFYIKNAVTT